MFTRDHNKVARWGDRVEVATGDFQKPETFARALTGMEVVFLMSQSPDQEAFARLIMRPRHRGGRE